MGKLFFSMASHVNTFATITNEKLRLIKKWKFCFLHFNIEIIQIRLEMEIL